MNTALLWILVFVITLVETFISTWEGRADRQSTHWPNNRKSLLAAFWAVSFELVLLTDIMVIVAEGWAVLVPVLAGAGLGKYWACERRRRNPQQVAETGLDR